MSKYICVEDFLKYIDDTICKGCREDGKDANGIVCRACQIMDMLGYVEDFPAADVAPRTDLGVLATARAIELLAASMEFLRNMDAIIAGAGSETYMSILCEYDDTLNDGYCLLRDIENFFEIIEEDEE